MTEKRMLIVIPEAPRKPLPWLGPLDENVSTSGCRGITASRFAI